MSSFGYIVDYDILAGLTTSLFLRAINFPTSSLQPATSFRQLNMSSAKAGIQESLDCPFDSGSRHSPG
jgi:hypothetical protein